MKYLDEIIYEENEDGSIKESNIEDFMLKNGVWALFGYSKETGERCCLNVGKSVNVGNEVLYDIACLHYLKPRNDGIEEYVNQCNEPCGFKYKPNQVQEYLYPYINLSWHSFQFIFIYHKSDEDIEKKYAIENNAKYWRNGGPYSVKKKINLTSDRFQVIGDLFINGGELYRKGELIEIIKGKLGYNDRYAVRLINDCVKNGFLYEIDDEIYTR